ncbi:MAG: hypothetical protein NT039_03530 [Candidatus Berkelbacteria bacterium]|nr:hypothetical protein [Candidatus Berkelbacteria bacterium]
MLERLKLVSDIDHLVNEFYPLLLERAGQELLACGVIIYFELALHQYAGEATMLKAAIRYDLERYIDAMVPDTQQAQVVRITCRECAKKPDRPFRPEPKQGGG